MIKWKHTQATKVLETFRSLSSKCNQINGLKQIAQFSASQIRLASLQKLYSARYWTWWVWNLQLLHNFASSSFFATMHHNFSFISLSGRSSPNRSRNVRKTSCKKQTHSKSLFGHFEGRQRIDWASVTLFHFVICKYLQRFFPSINVFKFAFSKIPTDISSLVSFSNFFPSLFSSFSTLFLYCFRFFLLFFSFSVSLFTSFRCCFLNTLKNIRILNWSWKLQTVANFESIQK